MKQAILIQCHKNPKQINLLLDALDDPGLDIYIHVDKKSDIKSQIKTGKQIFILPDEYRVDVRWAMFSQVEATLNLMRYASAHGDYGHYLLCSGQDFPLVKASKLVEFLNKNAEINFVQILTSKNQGGQSNNYDKRTDIYYPYCFLGSALPKRIAKRALVELTGGYNKTWRIFKRKQLEDVNFYYGSQWVCLSNETEKWMENYLILHPEFIEFYRHTNCPDESFFQTILMSSPYKNKRQDYLHYIDWSLGGSSPKNLNSSDVDIMMKSGKLMARKFEDEDVIKNIMTKFVNIEE